MTAQFKSLPSIDRVLSNVRVQELVDKYSHQAILELARIQLDEARGIIKQGKHAPGIDEIIASIEKQTDSQWHAWPSPIINATGVILHTNLGRAPLSDQAIKAIEHASIGYSNLELDLQTGKRGSRQQYAANMICQLTGADAALVVNNTASALLLGLAAVTSGKEVIVSRGEAVEIGGGFRIPDVLRQSGAELVEVGTTNRNYVRDFETAISDRTGAILSVHASNFRVTGFTHSPKLSELVDLGNRYNIPVLHDLGSGCLLNTTDFGLAHEPMPQESIASGVSMTFFSGDKLLGGPQAGIIAGDANLVTKASHHPLARALRIDKLSMAALTATLLHYIKDEAIQKIPVWQFIVEPTSRLQSRATQWRELLGHHCFITKGSSTVGGGSLPGETLPTMLLNLDAGKVTGGTDALLERLRRSSPPIIGRIEDNRILLDPRTVFPQQDEALIRVVRQAISTVT